MTQGEGGGRPVATLTDEQIVQVEALAQYLNAEDIADYLGIGRTTFYAIMDRNPEVSERYRRGKARLKARLAGRLIEKADAGDYPSLSLFLRTQAGWSEKTHIDHTSSDGSFSFTWKPTQEK